MRERKAFIGDYQPPTTMSGVRIYHNYTFLTGAQSSLTLVPLRLVSVILTSDAVFVRAVRVTAHCGLSAPEKQASKTLPKNWNYTIARGDLDELRGIVTECVRQAGKRGASDALVPRRGLELPK